MQPLWCYSAGLNLWVREVFRFIYSSDFEEERGNPVKEGLASFEGVLLHCAIDIADHCLGLSILHFLGVSFKVRYGSFPFRNLIYHSLDLILYVQNLERTFWEEVSSRFHLSSSPGVQLGRSQLHVQVGCLFFSWCNTWVEMKLRGRFPL